jgi:hypothetical protein
MRKLVIEIRSKIEARNMHHHSSLTRDVSNSDRNITIDTQKGSDTNEVVLRACLDLGD